MANVVGTKIIRYIRDNPGTNAQSIHTSLDGACTTRRLTDRLVYMRKLGLIENRGGRTTAAKWFLVDAPLNER